jgi:hypothetical protein
VIRGRRDREGEEEEEERLSTFPIETNRSKNKPMMKIHSFERKRR